MSRNPVCTWAAAVVLISTFSATSGVRAAERPATTAATTPSTTQSAQPQPPPPLAPSSPATTAVTEASEKSDWSHAMNRLGALLAGNDLTALHKAMEPTPPVLRAFATDGLQSPERLLGATTGSKILGVHAYDKAPTTLASDLAEDFASAGDIIPQSVRDGMVPPDAAAAKRANETAGQWLAQVLQPGKDDVTGVIVLWPQDKSRAGVAAATNRATFVLVKATKSDAGYTFKQLTFGDPLETPK